MRPVVLPLQHTLKGSERTLWFFCVCVCVYMTDKVEAAGRCVDDACTHQSFNLSLSNHPAESPFPPGTSCHTHSPVVVVFLSSFLAHYKNK